MKINLMTWHSEREMNFCPKHFVKTNATLTDASKDWILENLTGRFFISSTDSRDLFLFDDYHPYFEDPQEALLYELKWS